jgi:uncharacterized protein (TIGR03067 family)
MEDIMNWRALILVAAMATLAAADDTSKNDLDVLQGTWQMQSVTSDGKEAPAAEIAKTRFVIAGNKLTPMEGDRKGPEFTITVDATKKPATLDLKGVGQNRGEVHGIYRLDGDTLTICSAEPPTARPEDFTSTAGSKVELLVLKRDKK